jgi:hypothetical protein
LTLISRCHEDARMSSFCLTPPVINRRRALPRLGWIKGVAALALAGVLSASSTLAGAEVSYDSKEFPIVEVPVSARESRGMITLEGPSGMFLNPTSATLPQGTFGFGYCLVLTNQDTDILGHAMYFSYGVRDWLELGVVANMFNFRTTGGELPKGSYGTGGPMARIRLVRDREYWPEISLGAYSKMGTDNFDSSNVYLAVSKTVPIDEKGYLKTVTFQGGFRESWLQAPDRNTNRFYGGIEVQLPHNFYLIGEVTQFAKEKDQFTPWAAGIQWRGKRFGCTAAIVQSGDDNTPSIYLGIGGGLGPEPVRTPTRPVSRP